MSKRSAQLIKIHLAIKELGIDIDDYRLLLRNHFNVDSSVDLDDDGRDRLIQYFISLGWQPKAKDGHPFQPTSHKKDKTQIDKIRALWITLGQAGVIRSPTVKSLNTFVQRVAHVRQLDWLDSHQANIVIEALKAIAFRNNVELEPNGNNP